MSRVMRRILTAMLTAVLLAFSAFNVAAADVSRGSSVIGTQKETTQSEVHVAGIRRLTDEEIEVISDRISAQSNVYLFELRDGRYTYYISVDFRTDDAVYLAKLPVLRKTSHKLFDRSEQMAKEDADKTPTLMDYTQIVGELGLHHAIYCLTDLLGGESLHGLLGTLYRKCEVADLNIDENRCPVMIRVIGLLIGD